MKASELRIGNYVYERRCDGKLYEGQVTEIRSFDTLDKVKCRGWFADSPIPLTEEWLLKFGFKKDIDGSFVYGLLSMFKDKRLKQNVYIYTKDTNKGQWIVINDLKLQYVHQLQNLYHSLTDKEL